MNIAICDDNNDYINTLENYIDDLKVKNLEHDVFYSGEELLNEYKKTRKDMMLFLWIWKWVNLTA